MKCTMHTIHTLYAKSSQCERAYTLFPLYCVWLLNVTRSMCNWLPSISQRSTNGATTTENFRMNYTNIISPFSCISKKSIPIFSSFFCTSPHILGGVVVVVVEMEKSKIKNQYERACGWQIWKCVNHFFLLFRLYAVCVLFLLTFRFSREKAAKVA